MKAIPVKDILFLLKAKSYAGDESVQITGLIDLLGEAPASGSQLFWCNDKNAWRLNELKAGTAIISEAAFGELKNSSVNAIVVEKPRNAFKTILETYFVKPHASHYVAKSASIHSGVKLPSDVYIGENVVIEEGCEIGEQCIIGNNTVILSGTVIGNHVTIGCNNTIGGIGFGYEKNEEGQWEVIPHVGNVVIHDEVEIGNNTCIDRAVLGSTVIGKNVKIDNLVHVAHGVKIYDNALIIAHAMLGGSAVIGKDVWFGPSASILNKGVVSEGALIGMAAVVVKPVEENSVMAGNPAKWIRKNDPNK